jgi:hypothetical protein
MPGRGAGEVVWQPYLTEEILKSEYGAVGKDAAVFIVGKITISGHHNTEALPGVGTIFCTPNEHISLTEGFG